MILKTFRKKHDLTQKAAAELFGYSKRSWEGFEVNHREVPEKLIKAIKFYEGAKK